MPGPDLDIVQRDGYRCARCGYAANLHVHHRQPRSAGLNEKPSNKITLCALCHKWVHEAPVEARQQGWVVSRYDDPAEMPVPWKGFAGDVAYLTDDYGFAPYPPQAGERGT